jgi:hypothetical protein
MIPLAATMLFSSSTHLDDSLAYQLRYMLIISSKVKEGYLKLIRGNA